MKDIAIFGAGGFGREVACLLKFINNVKPAWNLIGFFDDGMETGSKNEYGKILGGIDALNSWDKNLSVAIAIGNPKAVRAVVSKISNDKIDFPNIVSPDTLFIDENNMSMGKGNILCHNCLISCNVHIGDFNIFNGYITLGHDVTIANCNSFMPGVRVSGSISIGDGNLFGANAFLMQTIKIGSNIVVGANSTLLNKPKDGFTYIGNPARKYQF